jgi:hypothetical protein
MDPRHLADLIAKEDEYWWHVAKRALVTELLKRHVPPPGRLVEGGVGGGGNLMAFRRLGYAVAGFDCMLESVEHCQNIGLSDVCLHDLQEPWPAPDDRVQAIVLLDVIEHVVDPVRVLANAAAILDRDGAIVVTVPAGPSLMGPWDRMLGHHRRYSRRLLREHAEQASLRIDRLSHWNAFTLPAAVVARTAERMIGRRPSAEFPKVSPTVNAILKGMAAVERRILTRAPIPLGLSLVGVLRHGRPTAREPKAGLRLHGLGRDASVQRRAHSHDAAA